MRLKNNNLFMAGAVALALALAVAACTCNLGNVAPGLQGGGAGSTGPWNDSYTTEDVQTITLGTPVTGNLQDLFSADNYEFAGTAGQTVTIRVDPIGGTDPRFKLYGPDGSQITEADDEDGLAAVATVTLPADGTYTIRVDVFSSGDYTVSVE